MDTLAHMTEFGHEQLVACSEPSAGLKAFIAIHDTTLGPSCGGVRIWPHATEEAAVTDVLRLSRAMIYKSAVAGLPLGGGKALIWADPRTDKTEALLRAFGRFVDTLGRPLHHDRGRRDDAGGPRTHRPGDAARRRAAPVDGRQRRHVHTHGPGSLPGHEGRRQGRVGRRRPGWAHNRRAGFRTRRAADGVPPDRRGCAARRHGHLRGRGQAGC